MKYEGIEQFDTSAVRFSILGKKVADLLGQLYQGIYHMNFTTLHKVDWSDERHIEIPVPNSFATFDFNNLTVLTILCHDLMIRCEIRPCNMQYLKLHFWQRKNRDGRMFERHPTIEDAIKQIREHYSQPLIDIYKN